MRIAIHNHDANVHKLYDSTSGEIVTLDEAAATQIDVEANGHLVKERGNWTLEVNRPITDAESARWKMPFAIDVDAEDAALEEAKSLLGGRQ
jgi:hypothetical protein